MVTSQDFNLLPQKEKAGNPGNIYPIIKTL
jgi:hypothetical protein